MERLIAPADNAVHFSSQGIVQGEGQKVAGGAGGRATDYNLLE